MIDDTTRRVVRQRAHFACEYCGLREADVSGELTVDHFQPTSKGGSDALENLIYCCIWCNQRKQAYWPTATSDLPLWNPRQSPATEHFLLLETGELQPFTEIGAFTLRRLQLNRPTLIAYRLRQHQLAEQDQLLTQYRDLLALQTQVISQLIIAMREQQVMLAEQQAYLERLRRQR
jgi:hypothetical protein